MLETVDYALSRLQWSALALISFVCVGFGQPAFSSVLSFVSALIGYALFFRVMLAYPSWKTRFLLGTIWYMSVQIVQLWWMTSHPYLYIYAVLLFTSVMMGLQFGILCLFIQPAQFQNVWRLTAIAGLWAVLEWSRLFFLSGMSWNPSGLALSANLYTLQVASLAGVFGLSFWVIFTNLLALKAWLAKPKGSSTALFATAALLPFLYGFVHVHTQDRGFAEAEKQPYKALLVQTAFPIEEIMGFKEHTGMVAYVLQEWKKILQITRQQIGKPIDLVVLPEFTVPFGTYSFVYPYPLVATAFKEIYGPENAKKLPPLESPLAEKQGNFWMVNNAFFTQALANIFNSEVVIGLEDAEDVEGEREYYSSALHFSPREADATEFFVNRYEKRVLVPMGEYIPFSFAKKLAASYGIHGSFTAGKEAKLLGNKRPMGVSICYEETFGDMMRENKLKGAEMLVNLTSDIWYPDSLLPRQHLDHSRLRTVENGIPLLRACNTGITCAVDSLGRTIDALPDEDQWLSESLYVQVPIYNYLTLYSRVGDKLIIGLSLLLMLGFLRYRD